uniref:Integrase, catalytic region, zinc finger, CCHC-type, peptidase aspartic, catalytic n=1 Tax=Tanacetum cinerariifolium TaxID=118510 RepID=A0A6L2JFR7_TANCI|nr:hypothetical protein [Tanacetum cinerariifolium]
MVEPRNETIPTTIRARTYTDLTDEEKIYESVNIKATKIVLQGLPQDIYNLVNHNKDAKRIWDRVKLLIQGSKLSLQERESKLYDDFDTFTSMLGETIHSYYMRFIQLINDMHTTGMTMKPLQVNRKFVNRLQPKWSKFVTNVKLAKDMHTTNFDHLYAHLRQHEAHANKVCFVRQSIIFYRVRFRTCCSIFNPSDDPVANLKKLMAFVSTTFGPRFPQTNNQLRTSSNTRNQATIQDRRVTVQIVWERQTLEYVNTGAQNNATNQGDCDDIPSAKAVLMANLSSYDSDVLLEVPFHDTKIKNAMSYQSVQRTQCSEQPSFINDTEVDITSDSNIISYEQYLHKTENPVVQSTSSCIQQDELLMCVIEEMSSQVIKCNKVQQENINVNETLTAELERYKEQVKLFEQRQKFDLNDR